jgi:transcriptional regulator with XRE-family HTH domain
LEYISKNVARNLKRIRKSRKMSLEVVSEQTGISRSMLGQIERGDSVPTIETLGKIVSGLRVSFNSLVSAVKTDTIIVEKEELMPSKEVEGKYKVYEYFPYEEDRTFEIYMMEISEGTSYSSGGHGENTYEYLTVITGVLTLEAEGKVYEIKEENSIRFPTYGDHTYSNFGKGPLKFSITFTWD